MRKFLEENNISFSDSVVQAIEAPRFTDRLTLRDYQVEALGKWEEAGRRGVLVLPTGAGKTALAVRAISELTVPTLVLVPTIDLLDQWEETLQSHGARVSVLGGGRREYGGLTVATYDSASIGHAELGNKFMFLVFDEVHHLPSAVFSKVAKSSIAPYRLGLTATVEREDGLHAALPQLVGPVVYTATHSEMSGKYLADFETEIIRVSLDPIEREAYEGLIKKYRSVLGKYRLRVRSPKDFQRLVILSGRNREIREALLARSDAQRLAFNADGKLKVLASLLKKYQGEKVIIFTQFNDLVESISRKFLVPAITHNTARDERKEILEMFRAGAYRCIATSKVLDEGVDVPDASVGIILSGSGSKREYIQRLGRILRRKDGKIARLIEVVTGGTMEVNTSARRKR